MNIFIAGCARSGTTLTNGLMGCFEQVCAHGGFDEDQEHPASAFDDFVGRAPHVVLKRTYECHRNLPQLRHDVALLYCVRHPYDVLTSTHRQSERFSRFHVSPERWLTEYMALRRLRALQPERRIFFLRYEDLIDDPDGVQMRIADHFGLIPRHRFSDNPAAVQIHRRSIEKWRDDPDLRGYLESLKRSQRIEIRRFCSEFGYVLPRSKRSSSLVRLANVVFARKDDRKVVRLPGNPIIRPKMLSGKDGANINGPSLVAAPAWLPSRLGRYYLYFADHCGSYIRLAYADRLTGPWSIHKPGRLRLSDAPMCSGHIASPDVHVDEARREIRMYFHGPLANSNEQKSFVAVSSDGIRFAASSEILAASYLRCVRWGDQWIGMDIDGCFLRSRNGLTGFERNPAGNTFEFPRGVSLRHNALRVAGSTLEIYYTRRGDILERIWRGLVDLTEDWSAWRIRDIETMLVPEMLWEGANHRLRPSRSGPTYKRENALRDPAIFVEDGVVYLLYAVAGEAGIAIAKLR